MFRWILIALVAITGCATTAAEDVSPSGPLQPYVWSPHEALVLRVDREIRDDGAVAASLVVGTETAHGVCYHGRGTAAVAAPIASDFQHVIAKEPLFVGYDDQIVDGAIGAHVALGYRWEGTIVEVLACNFSATGPLLQLLEQILLTDGRWYAPLWVRSVAARQTEWCSRRGC